MSLLSEAEIQIHLGDLPHWTRRSGSKLERQFVFINFVEAIAFVNRLVDPAEEAGHHPDLLISYNKVTVSLTTHDAGGLTEQDFALAQLISAL
jgi:4a-hydroxytetrahydrobiopterin dehydratase